MPLFAENELLAACRLLFGADAQIGRDFLFYMQTSGIKSAFRQKAKQTHPDLFAASAPEQVAQQAERFRDLNEAYRLLEDFSQDPHKRLWQPADQTTRFSRQPDWGWEAAETTSGDRPLPQRYLEIGLFLYHCGVISYAEMIEALVWQRRQRPVIGSLAERWGWLSAEAITEINRYHGRRGRFGQRALDLGHLTSFQLQVLLRYQQRCQKPFGQYFVEQGLLRSQEVETFVRSQRQHNARFSRR
ncbi:J domain-containing protein [Desulfuromonas thiophila]|uniref:J domain-containing protein n=1 Tax=Desulfuromonas thiophila TaxID=57664 RepID=UPI0029F512C8|nr:J domain-containing protein [Desulfuromonas thiophila]